LGTNEQFFLFFVENYLKRFQNNKTEENEEDKVQANKPNH